MLILHKKKYSESIKKTTRDKYKDYNKEKNMSEKQKDGLFHLVIRKPQTKCNYLMSQTDN